MKQPPGNFRLRRWLWGIFLVLVSLRVADYFFFPRWPTVTGQARNTGRNGLWLQDSWYRGTETETFPSLAARLRREQIRYAYFHTRFIQKDGTLRFHTPGSARRLVASLHRAAPDVRAIAWVYIGNARGLTGVDLSQPRVRANIVREARWLTTVCGFDGVQVDYEICANGDPNFLSLLRELRAGLPLGKLLSVATPLWLPAPFGYWGWSEGYFAQVAALCDQIAVMAYDSALYWPRDYVWLVHQQVVHATRAARRSRCRVLIGLPTYTRGGLSHHAYAENLPMALRGVREGLADAAAERSSWDGVAIFADAATDEKTWHSYDRDWLSKQ